MSPQAKSVTHFPLNILARKGRKSAHKESFKHTFILTTAIVLTREVLHLFRIDLILHKICYETRKSKKHVFFYTCANV